MQKRLSHLAGLILALALPVLAADATGTWSGQIPSISGTSTFVLRANGSVLTGTVKTSRGEVAVQDGNVSGATDKISFVTNESNVKVQYQGLVESNVITVTRSPAGAKATQFNLKRTGP